MMRCQHCGGNGKVGQRAKPPEGVAAIKDFVVIPCPDCEGTGIGYCCEGDIPVGAVVIGAK